MKTRMRVVVGIGVAIVALFSRNTEMGATISGSLICIAIVDYFADRMDQ